MNIEQKITNIENTQALILMTLCRMCTGDADKSFQEFLKRQTNEYNEYLSCQTTEKDPDTN